MDGTATGVMFYLVRNVMVAYARGAVTLDALPPAYDYLLGAARQAYALSDERAFDACVWGVMSLLASESDEGGEGNAKDSLLS